MTFKEYQEKAIITQKPFPTLKDKVVNCLLGISGETGEVMELFKKHWRDDKELDMENLTKEVGDILWYMAVLTYELGINFDDVAERNIAKLKARHGDKFSGVGDRSGAGK
ncbi:MAG: nucleoside triphosphate pyrophosphohydrolase family protein [Firmicutes bacterium]|nr:nucleoside triphosphate pyrophosphohydrolase family protein [Bacillota bacterium]